MLCRTALVWRAFEGIPGDRQAALKNHFNLLDKRYWELSTPSRALPVVGALVRSGVLLDGLERCAARSLANLYPVMTRKERSLVGKLSDMMLKSTSGASASRSLVVKTEDDIVRRAYAEACSSGSCTVAAKIDSLFVRRLHHFASVLMLLELLATPCVEVKWREGKPCSSKSLMDSICDQLMLHDKSLTFKEVSWLLSLFSEDAQLDSVFITPSNGDRLFRLCVRRLHGMLPDISVEQLLPVYLTLLRCTPFPKPFIVLGEMERLALSSSLEDLLKVSPHVILRFMALSWVTNNEKLLLQLCIGWSTVARIADLTKEECLLAFSVVAGLHSRCCVEDAVACAGMRKWEVMHDNLFAQVFFVVPDMTAADCFYILDQSERINISGWGITVPQMLLERLKKRVLLECQQCIRDTSLSCQTAERILGVALELHALLHRYTVLPRNAADESAIAECISSLEHFIGSGETQS